MDKNRIGMPDMKRARDAMNRARFKPATQDAIKRIHHSDQLALGPTADIESYIMNGDTSDINAVTAMLKEQKDKFEEIDITAVGDETYRKFMDVCSRLQKMVGTEKIHFGFMMDTMGIGDPQLHFGRKLEPL